MSDELMVKINWLSGQWVKIESVCEKARAMVRDLERKMKQLKLYPETKDRFLELADEMTKATGEIFTCTNRFDDLEAQTEEAWKLLCTVPELVGFTEKQIVEIFNQRNNAYDTLTPKEISRSSRSRARRPLIGNKSGGGCPIIWKNGKFRKGRRGEDIHGTLFAVYTTISKRRKHKEKKNKKYRDLFY